MTRSCWIGTSPLLSEPYLGDGLHLRAHVKRIHVRVVHRGCLRPEDYRSARRNQQRHQPRDTTDTDGDPATPARRSPNQARSVDRSRGHRLAINIHHIHLASRARGQPPSLETVFAVYDNALMGTEIGLLKTECIRTTEFHAGPHRTIADLEWATGRWIDWWNNRRVHSSPAFQALDKFE